jgi:uncharacterized membrane protein YphA (DoxX/SURF4 family)
MDPRGHTVDSLLSKALIFLSAAFLISGMMKIVQSKEKLAGNIPWTEDFSPGSLKLIGVLEIFGALGLFLPEVTGVATILTPVAATGVALTMIGASIVHMRRRERIETGIAVAVLALAVAVAWGRFDPYGV